MAKRLRISTFIIVVVIMSFSKTLEGENMKDLKIRWQRLVNEEGHTCERCGSTEGNVHEAYNILQKALAPLEIEVVLEESSLDPAKCAEDILESNRIWINDHPLEAWLGANTGSSPCNFCCEELGDDAECRTMIIKGTVYESIPTQLLIKAGLIAASELLVVEPELPCCDAKTSGKGESPACCPESDCHSGEEKEH